MHADLRLIASWSRDLAVAYAGGLALGAPLAVLAVSVTGRPSAATACLLVTMAALFGLLRRAAPQAGAVRGAPPAVVASASDSRRVA